MKTTFLLLLGVLSYTTEAYSHPTQLIQGKPVENTLEKTYTSGITIKDVKDILNSNFFTGIVGVLGTLLGIGITRKIDDKRRKQDNLEARIKELEVYKKNAAKLIPAIKRAATEALHGNACGNYFSYHNKEGFKPEELKEEEEDAIKEWNRFDKYSDKLVDLQTNFRDSVESFEKIFVNNVEWNNLITELDAFSTNAFDSFPEIENDFKMLKQVDEMVGTYVKNVLNTICEMMNYYIFELSENHTKAELKTIAQFMHIVKQEHDGNWIISTQKTEIL